MRRVTLAVLGLAAAALAVLSPLASGGALSQMENRHIGPKEHVDQGLLLRTKFKKGVRYKFVIRGWVDVSPSASRKVDAVYCFESAVGTPCQPKPYPVGGVQLTWFKGFTGARSTYSYWTNFPSNKTPPYTDKHVYDAVIVPKFDARLVVGVGGYDTDARDNLGPGFDVNVIGPPPCAQKPTKRVQRSLKVTIRGDEFCPDDATVAAGASVTICNGDPLGLRVYGLGRLQHVNLAALDGHENPSRAQITAAAEMSKPLGKGKCLRFSAYNPTQHRTAMYFYIYENAFEKGGYKSHEFLRLTIEPKKR